MLVEFLLSNLRGLWLAVYNKMLEAAQFGVLQTYEFLEYFSQGIGLAPVYHLLCWITDEIFSVMESVVYQLMRGSYWLITHVFNLRKLGEFVASSYLQNHRRGLMITGGLAVLLCLFVVITLNYLWRVSLLLSPPRKNPVHFGKTSANQVDLYPKRSEIRHRFPDDPHTSNMDMKNQFIKSRSRPRSDDLTVHHTSSEIYTPPPPILEDQEEDDDIEDENAVLFYLNQTEC